MVNRGFLGSLVLSVALGALAACTGSQPPIGTPGVASDRDDAHRGRSWMLPEAKDEDLLYVSATNQSYTDLQTYVYAYKTQKLVGTLSGVTNPTGLCVDASGDVFVADDHSSTIVEYAHGTTQPKQSIPVAELPMGCAVDPTSGDVAVTTEYRNIYVYKNGTGTPASYALPKGEGMLGCDYDAHGDFFVVGYTQNSSRIKYLLFELRKGGGAFEGIRHVPVFTFYDVKRDGKRIDVLSREYIYRLRVKGNHAKGRGSVKVGTNSYAFWLVPSHGQVVTSDGGGTVFFSTYPQGVFLSQLQVGGYNYNPVVSLARH